MNITWSQQHEVVSYNLTPEEARVIRKILGEMTYGDQQDYGLNRDETDIVDGLYLSLS
jgi:hypothetical protein